MGVQGARELVRRRAGEPQRCLKDCINSGLEDKARMSHKEGEHAVMGGSGAQLPVRVYALNSPAQGPQLAEQVHLVLVQRGLRGSYSTPTLAAGRSRQI